VEQENDDPKPEEKRPQTWGDPVIALSFSPFLPCKRKRRKSFIYGKISMNRRERSPVFGRKPKACSSVEFPHAAPPRYASLRLIPRFLCSFALTP
jgi:hypothetical protein